jgi:hypothetical protein
MRGSGVAAPRVRSLYLILAVLAVSVVAQLLVQLRLAAVLPNTLDLVLVWLLILLNIAAAIAGWWTAHRVAWMVYLLLSIAGLLLVGAATPITAALLLRGLWWG